MVTRADVERAAGGAPAPASDSPASGALVPLMRLQATIVRRMVEGASAPAFAAEVEIDMTEALALRASLRSDGEPAPSLNDLAVKAVALVLTEFPKLNSSFAGDALQIRSEVNVGVAVATDDALLVPTIADAAGKSLREIAAETRRLAASVRDGTVGAHELEGGTFTVTNLGMLGVRRFLPILNPPQAAILALGEIGRRPAVVNGEVVARDLMVATLVCDHRVVYGADAARFLARFRDLLEHPAPLAG
jgi:pyruvate dehydrogenase E2 component (dihydrolipoamide acetyltransferase)